MPILTQAQIDTEARSKWGPTNAAIQAKLMDQSLADFDHFIASVFLIFPELGTYNPNRDGLTPAFKSLDHHHHGNGCTCEVHTGYKDFSPQKITSLERMFRDMYGNSKAVDLLNMAGRWSDSAMPNEDVNGSGYWNKGYLRTITDTFKNAYKELFSIWETLRKRKRGPELPPMPLVVDESDKFIQDIYKEGYKRVTSKITQYHLPSIQEIMLGLGKDGKTWQDIAAELNQLGGADAYHWTRLVRSEMIDASQRAKIEQAKTLEGVNIKWSTSRMGNTCAVCEERNGKIFETSKMESDEYFATPATMKLDANRELKIGRFPHPQCRCSLSYTYKEANWK